MKKIFVFFSVILFVGCFEKDNHVITYYDEAKKVIKEIYVVDPVSGLKDSVYNLGDSSEVGAEYIISAIQKKIKERKNK